MALLQVKQQQAGAVLQSLGKVTLSARGGAVGICCECVVLSANDGDYA